MEWISTKNFEKYENYHYELVAAAFVSHMYHLRKVI